MSAARNPAAAKLQSTWKLACACAVSGGVPRRSLYVALIVGTLLNLINQGDAFLGMASILRDRHHHLRADCSAHWRLNEGVREFQAVTQSAIGPGPSTRHLLCMRIAHSQRALSTGDREGEPGEGRALHQQSSIDAVHTSLQFAERLSPNPRLQS